LINCGRVIIIPADIRGYFINAASAFKARLNASVLSGLLTYILRLLVFCASAGAALKLLVIDELSMDNLALPGNVLAQLDIYHSLFYAMLPIAAFLLLCPRFVNRRIGRAALCVAVIGLGAFSCALIAVAPHITRIFNRADPWIFISGAYVGLNVAGLVLFHMGARWNAGVRASFMRALFLGDVLLPMVLWAAYRDRYGRLFLLLRPIPVALVCMAPILPYLLFPSISESCSVKETRSVQMIRLGDKLPGNYYQVLADPAGGALILTAFEDDAIIRLNPDKPGEYSVRHIEGMGNQMQVLGLDPDAGSLMFAAPAKGATYVLDAGTLEVKRAQPMDRIFPDMEYCRTLWEPGRGILDVVCVDKMLALSADGGTVLARHHTHMNSGAAIDPVRGEVHVVDWSQRALTAFDIETHKPNRRLSIPAMSGGLAIDRASDRAYLTNPICGSLLVIDLESYSILDEAAVFPGVRFAAIDHERRRLLLSGFAPILEIRSLDDLSLIDRLYIPPNVTWMVVEPSGGRAFFTPHDEGVWSVDLQVVEEGSGRTKLNNIDPFYCLNSMLGRFLARNMGILVEVPRQEMTASDIFSVPNCP